MALALARGTAAAAAAPEAEGTGPAAAGATADDSGATEEELAPERRGPTPGVDVIISTPDYLLATEFDAPVSVTSFDAADLVAMGVEDVSGLAAFTPNLEIRSAGATASTFFIRGVGLNDFTANAAGSVAIYQDDIALNLPAIQLGGLFDVKEVEVLRGPQGSGAGRNASAGAIKIHSVKPTGEYAAFLRSEFGTYDSKLFEGALEVPLAEDVLSARMAFLFTERDPFLDNGCANAPPPGLARVTIPSRSVQPGVCGETNRVSFDNPNYPNSGPQRYSVSAIDEGLPTKLNDNFNWGARAQVRLLPPETNMDWLFNVHGSQIDQYATLGQTIGTGGGFFGGTTAGYRQPEIAQEEQDIFASLGAFDVPANQRAPYTAEARRILGKRLARRLDKEPFRGDYDRAGKEKQWALGGFARGDFEFDSFRMTSITGYERYKRKRQVDGDYTPNVVFESDVDDDGWQATQDLNFEGDLQGGNLVWNAGGYYLMDHLNFASNTITGPGLIDLLRQFEQKTYSFGIYAGFSWDFLDDFTLEAGARYNWEQKDFNVYLERGGPFGQVCNLAANPQDCDVTNSWDAPTGTVSLRYRFYGDVSAFVKYGRGWKGAQYNAGGSSGLALTVAEPETIDAWEIGASGSWLDGHVRGKGSLFFYDYSNYQVFITQNDRGTPPQRIVVNASDAQIYGAELEGSIQPLELLYPATPWSGLTLSARFGWLESEFLDFTNQVARTIATPQPPPIIVPVTIDYTGNRLPNTPKYKLSLTAEWEFDLGRYGWIVPRYDYTWTDDVYFDPSEGRGLPNDAGEIYMPEYAIGQRAYGIHNLRIAYRTANENIELAYWVRNLTDETYKTLAFDASANANIVGNLVGDPRTMGVSFTLRF